MMIEADLHILPIGSMCNYGMYENLKYMGFNDKHVKLEDRQGNKKEVYKELFFKYSYVPFLQG